MPETIPQIRPSFNRSLRLETRPELLSSDTGALVQRELMERSGLIDWLTRRLHDPRHPSSIRYPLSDLLRTRLLLLGQGWRDQSDADPCVRIRACGWRARPVGFTAALEEGHGLASQPTLSRLLDTLSREENLPSCTRLGDGAGVPSDRDDRRPAAKTGGKDPTEEETGKDDGPGRGRSPGGGPWASPGKRMERILSPADVPRVGGELCRDGGPDRRGDFPGASYLGKKALKLTLRVVDRCRGRVCGSMIVRMDAGFQRSRGC